MDKQLTAAKLESLRKCIARIRGKTPANAALLAQDLDLQDIVVLNLERSVQLCVDLASHILATKNTDIPPTMAECFLQLRTLGIIDAALAERMIKAVGFRNLAVHAYQSLNFDIVFSIITKNLDDFKNFGAAIVRQLNLPDE